MLNRVVVLALAALALAALVDGVKGGGRASSGSASAGSSGSGGSAGVDRLRGPEAPAPGALPGTLVAATGKDCRLRTVDFSTGSLGDEGSRAACRLWVSPDGKAAAVALAGRGDPLTREIGLIGLGGGGDPEPLGVARGEPAWAPDGSRLAWCDPEGGSVVHELASGDEQRVEGCSPRFAPDGALYTLEPRGFLRDGIAVLDANDLALAFGSGAALEPPAFIGYDVGPQDLLAVTAVGVTQGGAGVVLAIWRQNRLEMSVPVPETAVRVLGFGGLPRFSPDGTKLALGPLDGAGSLSVVDLRLGTLVIEGVLQRAFAWSPDGAWLALAVGAEVALYDAISADRVYTLPLDASALDWTGGS